MCIPTVGVCDTNIDSRLVTYPIAGNDDSRDTVHMWLDLFKQAIMRGKNNVNTPQIVEEVEEKFEDIMGMGVGDVSTELSIPMKLEMPPPPPAEEIVKPIVKGTPLRSVKSAKKVEEPAKELDKKAKFRRALEQLNREAEAAEKNRGGGDY